MDHMDSRNPLWISRRRTRLSSWICRGWGSPPGDARCSRRPSIRLERRARICPRPALWLRLWSSLCAWPAWLRLPALWRRLLWRRLLCRRVLIPVLRGRLLLPPPSVLRWRLLLPTSSWLLVVPATIRRYAPLVLRSGIRLFLRVCRPRLRIWLYVWRLRRLVGRAPSGVRWNGGWRGGHGRMTPLVGAGHVNGGPRGFAVAHGGAHFGGHMHGHFMH